MGYNKEQKVPKPRQYKTERVQMQIRLSAPVRRRLEREAQRRMVSKNFLIERAVEECLGQWEQQTQVPLVTSA